VPGSRHVGGQGGKNEEGRDLLRNALAAARLTENVATDMDELLVLPPLIDALFSSDEIDEVEPLVESYREEAAAWSSRRKGLTFEELSSVLYSARLHEVLCICTPCWKCLHTALPCSFHRGQ